MYWTPFTPFTAYLVSLAAVVSSRNGERDETQRLRGRLQHTEQIVQSIGFDLIEQILDFTTE